MKCLLQPPTVWTMTGDTTQDFVSWRATLETKLKTAAVDLLRDRAVINAWIWGLLDKHLQTGAEDLRPYEYAQTPWSEYVDLIEQKFAPANIRNYNIYLFKATKQKKIRPYSSSMETSIEPTEGLGTRISIHFMINSCRVASTRNSSGRSLKMTGQGLFQA